MSLVSGQKLNRDNLPPLPMQYDFIDRVHCLARINPNGLTIRDRDCNIPPKNHTYDDSDYESYTPFNGDSDDDNDGSSDDDDDTEYDDDENEPMPNKPVARDTKGVYHNNSNNSYNDSLEGVTHNNNNNGHEPRVLPKDDETKGVSEDEPPEGVSNTYIKYNKSKVVGSSRNKKVTFTSDNENYDDKSYDGDVTVTLYEPDNNQP